MDRQGHSFIASRGGKSTLCASSTASTSSIQKAGRGRGEPRRGGNISFPQRSTHCAQSRRHGVPEDERRFDDDYDNVEFDQALRAHDQIRARRRIEDALQRQPTLWGEVKDKLTQFGLAISGGQQQRVERAHRGDESG